MSEAGNEEDARARAPFIAMENNPGIIAAAEPGTETHSPMVERLLDLQLPVSVALGRAQIPIKDVLRITSGSMIELDREVGDLVEIIVHGTVVARGEIVLVKGYYGVRIEHVVSRRDRMNLLNE